MWFSVCAELQALIVVTGTGIDTEPHTAHMGTIIMSGTATALSDILLEWVANLISSPAVWTLELMGEEPAEPAKQDRDVTMPAVGEQET